VQDLHAGLRLAPDIVAEDTLQRGQAGEVLRVFGVVEEVATRL